MVGLPSHHSGRPVDERSGLTRLCRLLVERATQSVDLVLLHPDIPLLDHRAEGVPDEGTITPSHLAPLDHTASDLGDERLQTAIPHDQLATRLGVQVVNHPAPHLPHRPRELNCLFRHISPRGSIQPK